jgi:hypothetical protein
MRKCSICTCDNREEIDKLLKKGVSFREITRSFPVSVGSLGRHREHELAASRRPAPPDSKAVRSWRRILRRALATSDLASATRAQSAIDSLQRGSPDGNVAPVQQSRGNRDPEKLTEALRTIYGLRGTARNQSLARPASGDEALISMLRARMRRDTPRPIAAACRFLVSLMLQEPLDERTRTEIRRLLLETTMGLAT